MSAEPRVTRDQIRAARERYSVSDLVGKQVKLAKRGRELVGLCPFHQERSPSFTVVDDKSFYHCFGCGAHGDAIAWRMFWGRLSFAEAVLELIGDAPLVDRREIERRETDRQRRDMQHRDWRVRAAREIWRETRPLLGTPGDGYLRGRRILRERLPGGVYPADLRWHPHVLKGPKEEGLYLPAVVAAVRDLPGEIVAVHRIFLDPATLHLERPDKYPADDGKALLGVAKGGAVRLTPWAAKMGTCEGIETGLSVLQAWPERALWSGIDGAHMGLIAWPDATDELTYWSDRDRADPRRWLETERPDGSIWRRRNPNYLKRPGEEWTRKASEKFLATRRGRRALMALPPGDKADFNDLLQESAA